MLLISKYALDYQYYNTYDHKNKDITWGNCSLRVWLNGLFYKEAFSKDEKALIPRVVVENSWEDATKDQVFLLSVTEASKYFDSDSARVCVPTEYAAGTKDYDIDGCVWWLRTLSTTPRAAIVGSDGEIREDCRLVERIFKEICYVRPAIWIDLYA